jgi:hypothetical protein
LIGGSTLDTLARQGWVEALLRARGPGRAVSMVNLAHAGGRADAPLGVRGRDDLAALAASWKPGLILIGLGPADAEIPVNEALAKTLDALALAAANGSRVVIVAPSPCDDGPDLRPVSEASRAVARDRQVGFVDLFEGLSGLSRTRPERLTSNGLALSPSGGWWSSIGIEHDIGHETNRWKVTLDAASGPPRAEGVELGDVRARSEGVLFRASSARLPGPPPPFAGAPETWSGRTVRVVGLGPGRYTLRVDGQIVETADEAAWSRGVRLTAGPDFDAAEALRLACVARERTWQERRASLLWADRATVPGTEWLARALEAIADQETSAESARLIEMAVPVARVFEWTLDPARTAARR